MTLSAELPSHVADETRAQYHTLALSVSFLSGYCSVAYRHPRSANYITSEDCLSEGLPQYQIPSKDCVYKPRICCSEYGYG